MLNKMIKKTLLLAGAGALAMVSCKNDSQFDGYTRAESGLHYKFFNQDENAVKPEEGSGIGIRYTIKKQANDSLLVASKDVVQDGSGILRQILNKSACKGCIEDAIMMLGKGDSAAFIISADSFFLKTMRQNELPPFIKKGEFLLVNMKMEEVKTKKEIEENTKKQMEEQEAMLKKFKDAEQPSIDKYIADNKLNVTLNKDSIYFIQDAPGSGSLAQDGDSLYVEYTGMLLDGRIFDSSRFEDAEKGGIGKPKEYCRPIPILLGNHSVIVGWEKALRMMKKGTKARVILPSAQGYGPGGNGQVIPPYAPLMFSMEIVSIKKNK